MIRYSLSCDKGHGFEAWFANSGAYDAQARRGLVACPRCGSARVSKAPMAPGITRGGGSGQETKERIEALRRVREHVTKSADYVGDAFASEARKIHREEAEARSIYGKATDEEAKALREEGVEFHPLPSLPEDKN